MLCPWLSSSVRGRVGHMQGDGGCANGHAKITAVAWLPRTTMSSLWAHGQMRVQPCISGEPMAESGVPKARSGVPPGRWSPASSMAASRARRQWHDCWAPPSISPSSSPEESAGDRRGPQGWRRGVPSSFGLPTRVWHCVRGTRADSLAVAVSQPQARDTLSRAGMQALQAWR